ncbi:TonB-dependent receptor [Flavobacterium aquatile]|uniref:TonB-dependent receptor n=1 Tax=Flavobacterium aquatile LMG 4008 = ATCC 11947 TaxID=1453498 RepID=A0A095V3E7_9FLAO|nr:TonB-dependent receptor [Flavobacterium aquatile]KGD69385.1 TonB-dependent receptor [Flavobacterium aquatile LMG 4008 = ATCC 11947]OXA66158.1 TonB-dependent receptor [Flavobacterium aquatile] [Flavobacterium aquatile LMG 4008 = ATCC 11947]GEC77648.1 TonB-dependent receptor [Flavobacterium aquatile]
MRKIIFTLLLFLFNISIFAQQAKEKTSLQLNNATLKNSIETLETESGYKFYFDEKWLINDTLKITKNYQEKSIDAILTDLLDETDLNYFIYDEKVILTKNTSIISDLEKNLIDLPSETNVKKEEIFTRKPIYLKQYDSIKPTSSERKIDQFSIGKESKSNSKKLYTLSGFVKNLKTGEGISNLFIKVKNSKRNTVTDNSGFYTIDLEPGISVLEFESVIFTKSTKKIVLYNDGKLNVNLKENINELDEVIINSKASEKIKSTVTGVTVIEIEKIKTIPLILGERDIFRVAAALPGIKNVGEGASGYSVRGGKEDQNLVLLDNGLIYNPSHFFGLFSAVNPFTTKRAMVYKGSIPAEFGGRLSSVFDITTKSGNLKKLSGEAGIGPVTSNLSLEIPILKEKSSLIVGGRLTYSDWILKSLKDEQLKNSQASFYDIIAKYSHKFNAKNQVETTFYNSKDAFSISSDSVFKYTNRLFTAKWDHTFNEKSKGELIFTNSEYKFNIEYDANNPRSFDFGYKISDTQLQLKLGYLYNEKHKISYGISSKLYGINPGNLDPKNGETILNPINIEKERGIESAVYASDNYKFSDKLLIDVGLRYSRFSALGASSQRIYQAGVPINDATVIEVKNYGKNEVIKSYGGLEPRISARYFLMDDLTIKASYDKTYQYIHLLSSNTTQSPTDTWKLSDLNVKPQAAQQFSFGIFKNISNPDLEFSIEGYYKKSKNFLDYKVAAQILLNENIETELLQGDGKAYGVEFLIKKSAGKLNGWIGYTYSRTFIKLDSQFNEEKVNNGEYFPANFDKPHDISVVLNYKFTQRYSLSSNFVYQTGRPITYPIGTYEYGGAEYTLYSDRNKFRIPDYFRLDIGINVEGNHKLKKLAHSFWNFSIYNILGRNNPYSVFFVTTDGQIKAYKTSIFAMPVPTITYNFKF